jgi:hypothetical protein
MIKLEKVAYACMIAASFVGVFFMYDARRARTAYQEGHKKPKGVRQEKSLVGTKVDIPGVDWQKTRTNVVLAISPDCPYCVASLPFYRRLTAAGQGGPARPAVTVLSPGLAAETRKWLAREGVTPYRILEIPLGDIGVHRTPTLLVVDKDGVVTKTYEGRMEGRGEEELLRFLSNTGGR